MAGPARLKRWVPPRGILIIALASVLLSLLLFFFPPAFLDRIENALLDEHFLLRGPRKPAPEVVIVAIDEESIQKLGRWPWPRATLAEVIEALGRAGARVIALDIILSEKERAGEAAQAAELLNRYRRLGVGAEKGPTAEFGKELERLALRASGDTRLQAAIRKADNVVLADVFDLEGAGKVGASGGKAASIGSKGTFIAFGNYSERTRSLHRRADSAGFPLPDFLEAARGVGHVNMIPDPDGVTRWEATVIEIGGSYYPSLALQAARLYLGISPQETKLFFGEGIQMGRHWIPVDYRQDALINYAGPGGTFPSVSIAGILDGRVSPEVVKDKLVLVGATAVGIGDVRVTPFSPVYPGVEKHATVVGNVLQDRFLVRPGWMVVLDLFLILVLPWAMAVVLPRLRPLPSALLVVGSGAGLFAFSHLLFVVEGLWIQVIVPILALAASGSGIIVYQYLTEERERKRIRGAFQQYVSPDVVEQIVRDPSKLRYGGERREVTILFSDIRDFTAFSEQHTPDEVSDMLREYLTAMVDALFKHRGTLDKFIGDAVMAIFGAPIDLPNHAEAACRAAVEMAAAHERLCKRWEAEGREPFRIGFGINTGDVVVGNLGSDQRFAFTAIGDHVNVAARLETLNKQFETENSIIISEFTYEMAKDVLDVRKLGDIVVKGKTKPFVIYELLAVT